MLNVNYCGSRRVKLNKLKQIVENPNKNIEISQLILLKGIVNDNLFYSLSIEETENNERYRDYREADLPNYSCEVFTFKPDVSV